MDLNPARIAVPAALAVKGAADEGGAMAAVEAVA